ncbi:flagellar basal body rod protein FlgB [Brevibacillus sp. B_LB10_24]|uniref:flagellar basal body rod protein FlgB n=1 Tax=Brevibacillus sp. B_LB10_24 TaxID=3380645 RepID=UPI0038B78E61
MMSMDQLQLLARSLDVGMLRQRTIANNIANMDTPQFKSKQVVFEDLLHQQLSEAGGSGLAAYRTDPRHLSFGSGQAGAIPAPQIVSNPDALVQNNGNDVDVEYEMNQLAKNTIWYNGLVQMTNGYFTKLKTVIDGGGR